MASAIIEVLVLLLVFSGSHLLEIAMPTVSRSHNYPVVEVIYYVFPNFNAQPKEAAGEYGTLTSVFGRNWFS